MSQYLAGISPDVIAQFHLDRLPFGQVTRRPDELMRLDGVRAVVTGGGGGDLGQAIVHRLAAVGARVVAADVNLEAATGVAKSAAGRWGADVSALYMDVTDWAGVHAAMDEARGRLGGVDLLVNNAGGALRLHGPFAEQDPEAMLRVINLNFTGLLFATRAALVGMLPAGRGRIVNIASEGGKISLDGLAVYNAFGPHALERLASTEANARRAALEESYSRLTAGRFGLPEEVANVVAFLASPAGAYVHGTAVSVGGGLSD